MDNPYNSGPGKGSSVLGPTLKFKGELRADEDLLIRGRIEGSIQHSSNLKIGKEGNIKAEVSAEYIRSRLQAVKRPRACRPRQARPDIGGSAPRKSRPSP